MKEVDNVTKHPVIVRFFKGIEADIKSMETEILEMLGAMTNG
jgi:hypothetical protein